MRNLVNRKTIPILTALLATATFGVGLVSAGATMGTTISAGEAAVTTGASGSSTARVRLAGGDEQFNAFDITLRFDAHLTHVAASAPADGWMLIPEPRIDNEHGTVQVIAVRFDPCATNCPLFTATWSGDAAGRTELALAGDANQSLAQAGQYIAATFQAGSVNVTAPATATPPPAGAAPASTNRSSNNRRWIPTLPGGPSFDPAPTDSPTTPTANTPKKTKSKRKTPTLPVATPTTISNQPFKWW